MTPWTLSGPDRQAGVPPRPVTQSRPLDPLPPRLTPPPPPPPPRLPSGAGLLAGTAVVVGSPWVNDGIRELQYDMLRGDHGVAGIVTGILHSALYGLTWLRWDLQLQDGPDLAYRLAENLRTALFVVLALWLLRRLATTPVPPGAHRVLAVFAVPVVAATVAAVAGLGVLLLLGDGAYGRLMTSPQPVSGTLSAALLCGAFFGVLLAVLTLHRMTPGADPTRPTDRR